MPPVLFFGDVITHQRTGEQTSEAEWNLCILLFVFLREEKSDVTAAGKYVDAHHTYGHKHPPALLKLPQSQHPANPIQQPRCPY